VGRLKTLAIWLKRRIPAGHRFCGPYDRNGGADRSVLGELPLA
jgi:hypothetical protein